MESKGGEKPVFSDEEDAEDLKQQQPKDSERFKKQHSYTYWVQNNKEQFP